MSTYTPLASATLTDPASSVTFGGIPQTYTDLVLVSMPLSATSDNLTMQFNSDTGTNYSTTILWGSGSSAGSARQTSTATPYMSYYGLTNATPSTCVFHIMNYSNATTYKTVLARAGNASGSGGVDAIVGLWRSTSAITSIVVKQVGSNNLSSGSTFTLYGIDAQASAQAKATGGSSITTDGTYWYHTFNSSGTFTPTEAITADYLVVAGGGGGGSTVAGGGGAGGLRSTVTATGGGGSLESALSLTNGTNYTVTIGAGGTAGNNGNNSVFDSITSTAGGKGGSYSNNAGSTGGSGGGGGGGETGTNAAGGAGTANQGYDGGTGFAQGATFCGGGGGGASAVGANAASNNPGAGGNGVATSITGSSVTYAGGGGGGGNTGTTRAGGTGGGGNGGGSGAAGSNGTANTGGGGGGGGNGGTLTGYTGGSGIVIIRYAVQEYKWQLIQI